MLAHPAVRALGLEIGDANRVAEFGLQVVGRPLVERDFIGRERPHRLAAGVDEFAGGRGLVEVDARDGRVRNLTRAVGNRVGQISKRGLRAEGVEGFFRRLNHRRLEKHAIAFQQKIAERRLANRQAVVLGQIGARSSCSASCAVFNSAGVALWNSPPTSRAFTLPGCLRILWMSATFTNASRGTD